jgi:hypothetical protein
MFCDGAEGAGAGAPSSKVDAGKTKGGVSALLPRLLRPVQVRHRPNPRRMKNKNS